MNIVSSPKALFAELAMLRKFAAGLTLGAALAFSPLLPASPADAQSGPLCTRFGAGTAGLDGWGACTGAPNIVVTTSNVSSIGGASDYHLHLRDTSGASAACSRDEKYLGDWNKKMGGCGQFCFDFKVFKSGTPPGPITPSFTIWSGALRATFVANFTVTASDPWKQNICAPINLIQSGDNLPSGPSGSWQIAPTGTGYSASWNTIIQAVTMIQIPIDWTSDPSEEAGYDNFCMSPGNCGDPPKPEVTGCLKDTKVAVTCNPDGSYTITLTGAGTPGSNITLAAQTPGVTITPPQQPWAATTTWTLTGGTPFQAVTLVANATTPGAGSVAGSDLCCSGEIKIVLPDCPKKPPLDVKIDKTVAIKEGPAGNLYTYTLAVTNVGAPFTGTNVVTVTDVVPPGMTFTSVSGAPNWNCTPATVPSGGTLTCTYIGTGTIATSASLGNITITATAPAQGTYENCAVVGFTTASGLTDSNPSNNKSCVSNGSQGKTVDVAIEKTGGTSPAAQVNAYAFHLKITNVGAAFNGTGNIVVTDVVPAGMTFNTATGPNWTCVTLPAAAGSTITCTYTGTGPTAPNQPLGTIDISATATGSPPFPPFTNCGIVAVTPASGQTDSNAANNESCVTVTKPPVVVNACVPPKVAGAVPGQCVCPQGMTARGRTCVATPVCRSPMIMNAAGSACVCPQGLMQRGRTCVQIPVCRAPMVQNAAGTGCVCPAGLVQRGRSCVQPVVCKAPATLNSRGACQCPEGMMARGNGCFLRERPQLRVNPNDVIRIFPGMNGGPVRGEGRGQGQGGGGSFGRDR
jgi:uncharacterized repeat protein (TIGR01451 family)